MTVSRIMISREHLKQIHKSITFDGYRKYKEPKRNGDLYHTAAELFYEIFLKMCQNSQDKTE